jgi:hypothetical protein
MFRSRLPAADVEVAGEAICLKQLILNDFYICIQKSTAIVIDDRLPHFMRLYIE